MVDAKRVNEMLGPIKFREHLMAAISEVGLATGLAWTDTGGEVLQIEATLTKGRGAVQLTGKLGEVMQESAQAALTCIKARLSERLGMSLDFIRKRDLHIHVPEGAIPKDGPSAGDYGHGDGFSSDADRSASYRGDDGRDNFARPGTRRSVASKKAARRSSFWYRYDYFTQG